MLIYNAKKEFIGVDEKDLTTLGFSNLAALHNEVGDFADLFVKTPGFIHNFKHVHWIDFIACADSSEESKVIINVNNKNFRAKVTIDKIFLTDNASKNGYIVHLNNLRELTQHESENVSADVVARPIIHDIPSPEVTTVVEDVLDTPEFEPAAVAKSEVTHDPYETPLEVNFDDVDDHFDNEEVVTPAPAEVEIQDQSADMLDVGDLTLDVDEELAAEEPLETVIEDSYESSYHYDPQVASNELGLPLDLIEEFIQDFIEQAKEFKDGLYTALQNGELDQVKILSHKLKGVAANLRIEDAFEALATINTSDDVNIIEKNLNIFYKIIAKLAGEESAHPEVSTTTVSKETQKVNSQPDSEIDELDVALSEEDDDLYSDLLDIEDSQVPQKIDIPELADDDFVAEDIELDEIDLLNIEDEIAAVDETIELDEGEDIAEPVTVNYSRDVSAAEIGIDSQTFNELFEDYISEAGALIKEMRDAVDLSDFDTCRHEALKLQGMSDNMRVTMISDDLSTLMNSTDPVLMKKSIDAIEYVINQISKTGV